MVVVPVSLLSMADGHQGLACMDAVKKELQGGSFQFQDREMFLSLKPSISL